MACVINYNNKTYSLEDFKNILLQDPSLVKEAANKSQERLKAIQEVFNSNSELSKVGDVFSYAIYLDTIFPDSKVKDIVYHGNKETLNKQFSFVTKTKPYAERYDEKQEGVNSLLINVQNIKDADVMFADKITALTYSNDKEIQQKLKKQGFDSINSYKEIVVFEPEQIHILSSKQDIEGFKEFVNKNIIEKNSQLQLEFNYNANDLDIYKNKIRELKGEYILNPKTELEYETNLRILASNMDSFNEDILDANNELYSNIIKDLESSKQIDKNCI